MGNHLYITGAEPGSGKSAIVLAMMEMLSGITDRLGVFRPVVSTAETDRLLDLISRRYLPEQPREDLYGCTFETARRLLSADRYDELLKLIMDRFSALRQRCDHVVCIGTDYSSAGGALEFDFNIDLANNLGCLIMPVVRGKNRDAQGVADATYAFHKSLQEHGCDIAAIIINRVAENQVEATCSRARESFTNGPPVYVVREEDSLGKPTIGDIAEALAARHYYVGAESLNREISNFKVAAMELPDFLTHIEDGSLIITPGDRADIVLGSLLSYPSTTCPQIAGLLLTGGLEPAESVQQLIQGLGTPPVPILGVELDTFTTATRITAVEAALASGNERKIATALGIVENSVDLDVLRQRLQATHARRMTPFMFEHELIQRARARRMRIVMPEGLDERILRACEILHLRNVVEIILLGKKEEISLRIADLALQLEDVEILDPITSGLRSPFADTYYEMRKHKGISRQMAFDTMANVNYFATMMVQHGQADAMVSGAIHTTQETVRPAFEIIRARPDTSIVSSVFFMCLEDRVLVYGDCAINPDPDAGQLADIAISSAETARSFGIEPRVAMLSYSTGSSGKGADVEKVARAAAIAAERRPDLLLEGPLQYDAAVDANVARTKLPDSKVAGRATVFIFPDLNTGNNTYKAVQRSANAVAIGPVLQGLNKPVNDLSRGCTVADIVNTVAITAIQAQAGKQHT
jgi:phosphate acetyltransferase